MAWLRCGVRFTGVAAIAALSILFTVTTTDNEAFAANSTPTAATSCPGPPQGNRPQFTPPAHASGTIASISGATFTVTQRDNSSRTVATDANTKYDKVVTLSVGAIAVGDMVMAQGTASGNTFAATTIFDSGKPPQHPGGPQGKPPTGARPAGPPHTLPAGCKPPPKPANGQKGPDFSRFAFGTVQSVSGTTLTLNVRGGKTITVTTTGTTKMTTHQQGSFADLHIGDQVDAMAAPKSGTASNAATFTAARVSDRTAH